MLAYTHPVTDPVTQVNIHHISGTFVLSFYTDELPVIEALRAAGYEPHGYFWESVVRYLAPDLADALELDSEAGMFSAGGSRAHLEQLRDLIAPVLDDPALAAEVVGRAESDGFPLDD